MGSRPRLWSRHFRLAVPALRRSMALHPPQDVGAKLIFAPSSTEPINGQAEQFTKHEVLGLRRADLDPASPITQFHAWFTAAQRHNRPEKKGDEHGTAPAAAADVVRHPETCTLSTASLPSGRVSARVVYMKELDQRGFVVYSNFGTSRKAADLFGPGGGNPWAALTFWWEPMERQVRVEGRAERLPPAESQRYFDTRARGSRIGAWASRQSTVLRPDAVAAGPSGADVDDGRSQLERWVREAEERFAGTQDIPVPEFWGGLRIVPLRVEFWQGRESRLHDRFVYERADEGADAWTLERLSP